jgi:hypothetical protein
MNSTEQDELLVRSSDGILSGDKGLSREDTIVILESAASRFALAERR